MEDLDNIFPSMSKAEFDAIAKAHKLKRELKRLKKTCECPLTGFSCHADKTVVCLQGICYLREK